MFGKRLRKLRNEFKYTQQNLADKLDVNRATIAGYETKGIEPSYETLIKLSKIFGVSIDYLLGNTDERKPADEIKKTLADNPELLKFWEELSSRDDLQLMFKEIKELKPSTIHRIREIIKIIEEEKLECYDK